MKTVIFLAVMTLAIAIGRSSSLSLAQAKADSDQAENTRMKRSIIDWNRGVRKSSLHGGKRRIHRHSAKVVAKLPQSFRTTLMDRLHSIARRMKRVNRSKRWAIGVPVVGKKFFHTGDGDMSATLERELNNAKLRRAEEDLPIIDDLAAADAVLSDPKAALEEEEDELGHLEAVDAASQGFDATPTTTMSPLPMTEDKPKHNLQISLVSPQPEPDTLSPTGCQQGNVQDDLATLGGNDEIIQESLEIPMPMRTEQEEHEAMENTPKRRTKTFHMVQHSLD